MSKTQEELKNQNDRKYDKNREQQQVDSTKKQKREGDLDVHPENL